MEIKQLCYRMILVTLILRGPFSLCFWMKTDDPHAEILASGQFQILMSDGFLTAYAMIGSQLKSTEPFLIPVDQWVHLIFGWDGNKLFLYRNNEEVVAPINATGNLTGDSTLTVGGRKLSSKGPYEGLIDDLRIFDQFLTSAQRNQVLNFVDPPLIAYFGEEFSYQIESLKGPTDFNVTGLPDGISSGFQVRFDFWRSQPNG